MPPPFLSCHLWSPDSYYGPTERDVVYMHTHMPFRNPCLLMSSTCHVLRHNDPAPRRVKAHTAGLPSPANGDDTFA